MVQTPCTTCGALFWETYRGARAETGEFGEDLCPRCERARLCAIGDHDDPEGGKCGHCGADLTEA